MAQVWKSGPIAADYFRSYQNMTAPSNTVPGDILVFFGAGNMGAGFTPASGWLDWRTVQPFGSHGHQIFLYKVPQGYGGAQVYQFPTTHSSYACGMVCLGGCKYEVDAQSYAVGDSYQQDRYVKANPIAPREPNAIILWLLSYPFAVANGTPNITTPPSVGALTYNLNGGGGYSTLTAISFGAAFYPPAMTPMGTSWTDAGVGVVVGVQYGVSMLSFKGDYTNVEGDPLILCEA